MRSILLVALAALWLGGCASNPITNTLGQIATGTLVNPISTTNIYELKNVYAIAAQAAVSYRGYCYARPYATLMADPVAKPLCQNRRANVRRIQSAKATAYSAVVAADNFVKNNPKLDASAIINTAWSFTVLQNTIPAIPK